MVLVVGTAVGIGELVTLVADSIGAGQRRPYADVVAPGFFVFVPGRTDR